MKDHTMRDINVIAFFAALMLFPLDVFGAITGDLSPFEAVFIFVFAIASAGHFAILLSEEQ
jgi:hypothetical protein